MKPFDLEKAKSGAPVCTRDGKPVRIICWDAKNVYYPIIALVTGEDGREGLLAFPNSGKHDRDSKTESELDLVMAGAKKAGWINIYMSTPDIHPFGNGQTYPFPSQIFFTKEHALEDARSQDLKLLSTVRIEWEE